MKIFTRNFTDLWQQKNYTDLDVSKIPGDYRQKFKCAWNSAFTKQIKLTDALKTCGISLEIVKHNGATFVSQPKLSNKATNGHAEETKRVLKPKNTPKPSYQLVNITPKPGYQLLNKTQNPPLTNHVRIAKPVRAFSLEDTFYSIRETTQTQSFAQGVIVPQNIRTGNSGLIGISKDTPLYLNTDAPFWACICGLQGSGKSHTACTLIENCMLPFPEPAGREVVRLRQPMAGLVLHYDQMESNICESAGLAMFQKNIHFGVQSGIRVVVLVSPSYYLQRKDFYKEPYTVLPLMFKWDSLHATQIRSLMRLDDDDNQLYISVMLAQLRDYQRASKIPSFASFFQSIRRNANLSMSQSAPLNQRVEILNEFVYESNKNESLRGKFKELKDLFAPGTLVIADLTDPMLAPYEATAVFQVLLQQFRSTQLPCGKLLVWDEAHKYFNKSEKCGFTKSITETVRLMRHEGLRVIVSSQSPEKIPTELLELSSLTIVHNFISIAWFNYLKGIYKLTEEDLDTIMHLGCGEALIHARGFAGEFKKLRIREKLTLDFGASRLN